LTCFASTLWELEVEFRLEERLIMTSGEIPGRVLRVPTSNGMLGSFLPIGVPIRV